MKVTLYPSHPSEGWQSMDRYWRELVAANAGNLQCGVSFSSPLGKPPTASLRRSRVVRIAQKQVIYPWRAALSSCDIAHVLDHSYGHLLGWIPKKARKVVTIHDLAPLHELGSLTRSQMRRFRKICSMANISDKIVCDSRSTADDAMKRLGLPSKKIEVLLLGVSPVETTKILPFPEALISVGGKFRLLSIGSTLKRKNLESLPQMFRELGNARSKVALIRVGARLPVALSGEIRGCLGEENLIELGSVSENMLHAVYQNCQACIMPSIFEGFGFPVIEAMAAGCPVISSNATSLPEVGGNAALYFDPLDPRGAAAHIHSLLNTPDLVHDLRRRGHIRAEELSWQNHLTKLTTIYQMLA